MAIRKVAVKPTGIRPVVAKKALFPKRIARSVEEANAAPKAKSIKFEEGQKVVYPGHGVGQILSIESKEISGSSISFYMIRVLENDITVMVPVEKVAHVGVRPVVGEKEVKKVYEMLRDKKVVVEQSTWNRRYREYMEKIKTGCVFEITEVLRDLCVLRAEKVLSFGERKMLELAKGLLIKELAIAEESDEPTVEAQIEELFAA